MKKVLIVLAVVAGILFALSPYLGGPYFKFNVYMFLYHEGLYKPNMTNGPMDALIILISNRSLVNHVAHTVLSGIPPDKIQQFRSNPSLLAEYISNWTAHNIKPYLYVSWERNIINVLNDRRGKCTDAAMIGIATFIYFNYSHILLILIPDHALAGFWYNGNIYVYDELYGVGKFNNYIKWYKTNYGSFGCDDIKIYELDNIHGEYKIKTYNGCSVIT